MDQLVVALDVDPQSKTVMVLTIYSRPGCHLCDEMKTVVLRAARSVPLTIEEIDISLDAELDERYGLEIPVLMVNGQKAAKYRVTEEELARILVARAGESGGAGGPGRAGGPGGAGESGGVGESGG